MPTFQLASTTAVAVKPYEYEGTDSPKPLKKDLEYVGSTTYGEITLIGDDVFDFAIGDIVSYLSGSGVETMINEELVRIIEQSTIQYSIS